MGRTRELVSIQTTSVRPEDVGRLVSSLEPPLPVVEVGCGPYLSFYPRDRSCILVDPRVPERVYAKFPRNWGHPNPKVYAVAGRLSEILPFSSSLLLCVSPTPETILDGDFGSEICPFVRLTRVVVVAMETASREWLYWKDKMTRKVRDLLVSSRFYTQSYTLHGGRWTVECGGGSQIFDGYFLSNFGDGFSVVVGVKE